MTPDEFRKYGHEVVDWIADYFNHPERVKVLPAVTPGFLIDQLPPSAPDEPEPMERILDDFRELVVPGMTHWNHPGFMAYFSVTGSPPGILAEALIAALNVNHMVWKSSPAATELEQVTMGWLRQWLNLPESFFGMILDTASTSTMHGIAAAREYADPGVRTKGGSRDMVLYTSEPAHSSVEKGAIAIGVGQENVRKIGVDERFAMRADLLAEAIERDIAAGLRPFCIVPTIGTTSTTAIDPVPEVIDIAARHDIWVHVDAAYGGSAAIVPEFAGLFRRVGEAHSLVMNPHKWLGTPIDLSAFYTRRPDILKRAFSLVPEYLKTGEDGRVVNLMDYGVPLGRRFRSLKLWFVMRAYGRDGLADKIREHLKMAQEIGRRVQAHPEIELCATVLFSLVCLRLQGSNERNQQWMEAINRSGKVFVSHTMLNGQFVVRFAIGNYFIDWAYLDQAWSVLEQCAGQVVRSRE